MKGMLAIIRKEFARFFLDRRMLLTTVILPGVLIYLVYTLMGTFISGLAAGDESYSAAVRNMPQSVSVYFQGGPIEITAAEGDDEQYKERVREGSLDIYVVFPEDFEEVIQGAGGGGLAPPHK